MSKGDVQHVQRRGGIRCIVCRRGGMREGLQKEDGLKKKLNDNIKHCIISLCQLYTSLVAWRLRGPQVNRGRTSMLQFTGTSERKYREEG